MLPSCSITVAAVQGTRQTFEDRVDVSARLKGPNPYIYAAVYDGHGGNQAAIMAQEDMLKTIEKQPSFDGSDSNMLDSMRNAFRELNEEMRKVSDKWPTLPRTIYPRPGTTATCAFITPSAIHVANVGDSPMFVLYYNSQTNTFSSKLVVTLHEPIPGTPEHQRILAAGGNMSMRGSSYAVSCNHRLNFLRMTRAFGDFWCANFVDNGPILSAEPECSSIPLTEEVVGIVLASDGFDLKEKKINKIVKKINDDLKIGIAVNFSQRFIKELYDVGHGRMDNVTIVCISFLNFDNAVIHRGLTYHPIKSSTTESFNKIFTDNPCRQVFIRNNQVGYCTTEAEVFQRIHPTEVIRMHSEPGYISPASAYLPIAIKKMNSELERYFEFMKRA